MVDGQSTWPQVWICWLLLTIATQQLDCVSVTTILPLFIIIVTTMLPLFIIIITMNLEMVIIDSNNNNCYNGGRYACVCHLFIIILIIISHLSFTSGPDSSFHQTLPHLPVFSIPTIQAIAANQTGWRPSIFLGQSRLLQPNHLISSLIGLFTATYYIILFYYIIKLKHDDKGWW